MQLARELLRHGGFTEHHRDNGVIGARKGKPCRGHFFTEQARVSPQTIAQLAARFHHLQHFDGGGDNRWRQRVGEQIRTRALAQPLDDFFTRGGIAAGRAAQRFTQRTGDNVDAAHHVAVLMGAAAVFTHKTHGVRIIDHHQRVVLIRQIADALQVGDHPVHGEHAVGGDQHMARAGFTRLFQTGFQLLHIVVGIAEALRFTQAHAVDDRRVVQGIGDNRVLCAEQGFKQAAVGVEAGGVQNRIFHTEKIGQLLLKRFVAVLGTADKAHGGHAEAVAVHPAFRGGNQFRVVREAEIVIGAEVNDLAAADGDIRLLRRSDDPFFFKQPFRTRGIQVIG